MHMHACMCVCMCACMLACVHVYNGMMACQRGGDLEDEWAYVHPCMHTYTPRTYILHTCIHTYIHTYIHNMNKKYYAIVKCL
jgi:hypothetical protein